MKRVLGLWSKPYLAGYEYPNKTDLEAHAPVDREIGAEGIVLLDNKQALPMTAGIKKWPFMELLPMTWFLPAWALAVQASAITRFLW